MDIFETQLRKAQKLDAETVSGELFDFIRSIGKELVEMNKKQINEDSEDIYGNAIGFYSKATEIITRGAKKAGEPFDGDDTGNWLDKFYVAVENDIFYFGSTDPKTDDILESPNWISHDLFGLTEENLNNVIEDKLLPFILNFFAKALDI